MKDSWDDELLSAYLDGEVNADERAHVERALAADPRLRQLHDELLALRQSLQSLPPAKLGSDFTARVVAQAQRALLAQNGSRPLPEALVEAKAPSSTAATVRPLETQKPLASRASWRVMVGSVAALAAALLMALMLPDQFNGLARHVITPQPVEVAMTPDVETVKSAAGLSQMVEEGQTDQKQVADGVDRRAEQRAPVDRIVDAAKKDEQVEALPLRTASPQGDATGAPAAPPGNLVADGTATGDKGSSRPGSPIRGAANASRAAKETDQLLVVEVAVAPAADRPWKFAETLSRNRIEFEQAEDKSRTKEAEEKSRELRKADAYKGLTDELTKLAQPFRSRTVANEVELVYVEATPEQIEATLRDLREQSGVSLKQSGARLNAAVPEGQVAPSVSQQGAGAFRAQSLPRSFAGGNAAGNEAAGKGAESQQLTPSTAPALPSERRGGFGGVAGSGRGGRGGGGGGFGGGGFGRAGGREGAAETPLPPPAPASTAAAQAAPNTFNELSQQRPRANADAPAPAGIARRIAASEFDKAKNLDSMLRDQIATRQEQQEKKTEGVAEDRATADKPGTLAEAKDTETRAKMQDLGQRRVRVLFVIQAPPSATPPPAPADKPQ